ncbi:MAG: TetR/AcrR family transcriptional regulator [Candidatus Abyssobacteria bacterium SURF_5]|uniref:TetR/AcrR family transcriptional regulator n=1 Tax=Abyssobacteria bacterium (strain SURF_5) TaxID=2093360 RepID=A0A3A4NWX3_ABYX5|nr:MAG: TetR/AcrR family transcriptional regulator [Candidatus Abyssubacteria bacterium SURF_5]
MAKQKSNTIRESIIDAAIEVFARTGFYKAKAAEIAGKADVAVGTIYNYFKNKDDILISIFNERIGELTKSVRTAIEKVEKPEEKLSIILDSTISVLEHDRKLAEVITIELRQSNKFFSSTAIASVTEFLDLITDVIREGQKKKVFRLDIDPRFVSLTILGTIENLLHVWVLGDKVPELKSKYDISLVQGAKNLKLLLTRGLH